MRAPKVLWHLSLLSLLLAPRSAPARESWTYETLGAVWAAPLVVADGRIFLGSEDSLFYSFAPDGRLLWSYKASEGFSGWPVLLDRQTVAVGNRNGILYLFSLDGELEDKIQLGGPLLGPPARHKQRLYLGVAKGQLAALEGRTLRWSHPTGSPISSWPAVDPRGRIYIGCADGGLLALDPQGNRLWRTELAGPIKGGLVANADGVIAATAKGEVVALDPAGKRRWRHAGAPVEGGLAAAGELLLVGRLDGTLEALDSRGQLRWRLRADGPIQGLPTATAGGILVGTDRGSLFVVDAQGTVRNIFPVASAPLVGGATARAGRFYFGSKDRRLYVLADKQRTPWTTAVGRNLRARLERTPRARLLWRRDLSGPVARGVAPGDGGSLLVGTWGKKLFCLDAQGEVRWSYNCDADVDSLPAVTPSGDIRFGCNDGGFYGLKPDGQLRFRLPVNKAIASSPAVARDGTTYFGAADSRIYALDPDGKILWKIRTGDEVDSAPRISPTGVVYIGSDDGHLYSLSPLGHIHWYHRTRGAIRSRPALGPSGAIYVTSMDQHLYALSAEGSAHWHFQTAGQLVSSPLVDAEGTIFFGSRDHHLYAVGPDGSLRWRFATAGEIDSTPAALPDGGLVFGADDGNVYAMGPRGELRWWYPAGAEVRGRLLVRPDGQVMLGTMDGAVLALAPPAAKMSAIPPKDTPAVLRRFRIGRGRTGPLARQSDGTLVVAGNDGVLRALEPGGWPLWLLRLSDTPLSDVAQLADGTMLVTDRRGWLTAVQHGRLRFSLRLDQGALSPPTVLTSAAGQLALVGSPSGRVWAVTPTGQVRWFFAAPGPVSRAPLPLAAGAAVVSEDQLIGLDLTGQRQWSVTLPTRISSGPTKILGGVVVADGLGNLRAFSPTGKLLWRQTLARPLDALSPSDDSLSLLALDDQGQALELEAATGRLLWGLPAPVRPLGIEAATADQALLWGESGSIWIIDRRDGGQRRLLDLPFPPVGVQRAPEGVLLATQRGEVITLRLSDHAHPPAAAGGGSPQGNKFAP